MTKRTRTDGMREADRRYRATHPERTREARRRYVERDPERERARSRANTFKIHHRITLADKMLMLQGQSSCCYLCGDEITLETAVIEHDHRCCKPPFSCQLCRRGLSCQPCNKAVGYARDDPARLRHIADSLEVALMLVNERMDMKPEQLSLI